MYLPIRSNPQSGSTQAVYTSLNPSRNPCINRIVPGQTSVDFTRALGYLTSLLQASLVSSRRSGFLLALTLRERARTNAPASRFLYCSFHYSGLYILYISAGTPAVRHYAKVDRYGIVISMARKVPRTKQSTPFGKMSVHKVHQEPVGEKLRQQSRQNRTGQRTGLGLGLGQ